MAKGFPQRWKYRNKCCDGNDSTGTGKAHKHLATVIQIPLQIKRQFMINYVKTVGDRKL